MTIPSDGPVGTFTNTTSTLSQGGLPAGEPASADIIVEAASLGAAIPATSPIGAVVPASMRTAAAIRRLRWTV